MTAMPEDPRPADSFVCTALVKHEYTVTVNDGDPHVVYASCDFHARDEYAMQDHFMEDHMREESGWCCGECGKWHWFESDAQGCCKS